MKNKKSKYKRTPYRVLIKDDSIFDPAKPYGRVVAVSGKNFIVKDLSSNFTEFECAPAGTIATLHQNASLIVVGDYVNYQIADNSDENLGMITAVAERKTWLSRKPIIGVREDVVAANANVLMIIMSSDFPPYKKRLIDRLIVASKIGNLEPVLCINKIDLFDDDLIYEDLQVYSNLNYPIFFTSAKNGSGLEELRNYIDKKEVIFSGPSGVGKSSILNKLLGKDIQTVKEISMRTTKGRHTTSFSRLFELDKDTIVIDTPGFREFGIVNINKIELGLYFDDFSDFYEHCRFMPCSHTHEPGCAVKHAVEKGLIDSERYESYLNIYASIE